MNTEHEKRIKNRAAGEHAFANASVGECCDDELLFAMKDNHHEFTMGITTILTCLRVAEKQNAVPLLPDRWWQTVMSRYRLRQMDFEADSNEPSAS